MSTKKLRKNITILLTLFLSLLFLSFQYNNSQSTKDYAEIIFFDVGQGDAILIVTANEQKILIDGGPDNILVEKIGDYINHFNNYIDIIILSHPHADHLNGLLAVADKYNFGKLLYYVPSDFSFLPFDNLKKIAENKKVKLIKATTGQKYIFKDNSELLILYPFGDEKDIDDLNDYSVVAKYCYFSSCVLLTGDAGFYVENKLLNSGLDLTSSIIKLGHHGSHYSTIENFLTAVKPSLSVIQVGTDNKYNHPHLRTLKKLKRNQVKVLRTDINGDISVKLYKDHYLIKDSNLPKPDDLYILLTNILDLWQRIKEKLQL